MSFMRPIFLLFVCVGAAFSFAQSTVDTRLPVISASGATPSSHASAFNNNSKRLINSVADANPEAELSVDDSRSSSKSQLPRSANRKGDTIPAAVVALVIGVFGILVVARRNSN